MERDTKTSGVEPRSEEPILTDDDDLVLGLDRFLNLYNNCADPGYFEVPWKKSACHKLPDALVAGFRADRYYRPGRSATRLTKEARASMAVCNLCPIREACGKHGGKEEGGIWGGVTPQIRDGVKRLDPADAEWFARADEAVGSSPDLRSGLAALLRFVESDRSS